MHVHQSNPVFLRTFFCIYKLVGIIYLNNLRFKGFNNQTI